MKAYIVYVDEDKDMVDRIFINKTEARKYALKSEGVMVEYDVSEACDRYIKLHIAIRDTMRDSRASASFNTVNVYTYMQNEEEEEGIKCETMKGGMYFSIDLNFPSELWTRITVEERGREIAIKIKDLAKCCLSEGRTIEQINEEFKTWNLDAFKQ